MTRRHAMAVVAVLVIAVVAAVPGRLLAAVALYALAVAVCAAMVLIATWPLIESWREPPD